MNQLHRGILLLLLILVTACDRDLPGFVEYEFDGFSISLPTRQPGGTTEQGRDGIMRSINAEADGIRYLLVYWELPADLRSLSDQQILESMLITTGTWKETHQKNLFLAGLPAKEIEGHTTKGTYALTRMVRARDRVYLLTVGGPDSVHKSPETRIFFNSFKIHGQ